LIANISGSACSVWMRNVIGWKISMEEERGSFNRIQALPNPFTNELGKQVCTALAYVSFSVNSLALMSLLYLSTMLNKFNLLLTVV
jgi:hypothetical protein